MIITIALSVSLLMFVLGLTILAFYNLTNDLNRQRVAGVFAAGCGIILVAGLIVSGVAALAFSDSRTRSQVCADDNKIYYDDTCYEVEQYKIIKGEGK